MPDPELGAARAIPCAKRGTAVNGMTGKALVFEVKRLSNLADHLLKLDNLFCTHVTIGKFGIPEGGPSSGPRKPEMILSPGNSACGSISWPENADVYAG